VRCRGHGPGDRECECSEAARGRVRGPQGSESLRSGMRSRGAAGTAHGVVTLAALGASATSTCRPVKARRRLPAHRGCGRIAHHSWWRISGGSICAQPLWTAFNGSQPHQVCPGRCGYPSKHGPVEGRAFGLAVWGSGVRVPSAPPLSTTICGVSILVWAYILSSALVVITGLSATWSETGGLNLRAPNRVTIALHKSR